MWFFLYFVFFNGYVDNVVVFFRYKCGVMFFGVFIGVDISRNLKNVYINVILDEVLVNFFCYLLSVLLFYVIIGCDNILFIICGY